MKYGINKAAAVLVAGMMLGLAWEPMEASASPDGILQTGGVAVLMETNRTAEEYIQAAEEAKGAAWGYTNLGIANVTSGNLNVRVHGG